MAKELGCDLPLGPEASRSPFDRESQCAGGFASIARVDLSAMVIEHGHALSENHGRFGTEPKPSPDVGSNADADFAHSKFE